MGRHTMFLLILGLFFHTDLLHCDEFEKVNFNEPLSIEHDATRNHNLMDSTTDNMCKSTPGIDQTNQITPHYSYFHTLGHETYLLRPTALMPKIPSFIERFPQANRRNQKITQRKISNRQLKYNAFRDQPRHPLHQGITRLEISKGRIPESEAKASSYDLVRWSRDPALHVIKRSQTVSTRTKKRLLPNILLSDGMAVLDDDTYTDDDDEFEKMILQIDAGEEIMRIREITDKLWYSDETETPTATTSRKFLRHNTFGHSYFGMIETLQEGYMMVFLIELTRLIATKERKSVRDVIKHADQIIHGFYQSGQLMWFGKPLITFTRKVARLLKESKIDVIQDQAANLHHMLNQRHQELSVEVNTILEYADMLYEDDEGRLLFDALNEFAAFPNIRLTGYLLCNSLMHIFLRPYRRLKGTRQRQDLMDSVNLELQSYIKTTLRSGAVRQADDLPNENRPSAQIVPVTQKKPHGDTTRSPRERKEKRNNQSLKRKRGRKRHRTHRHRPEYSQRYYQKHSLGSMTERTSVQSRYIVKNQKS